MLENFPSYIKNFKENKNIVTDIVHELHQTRFSKKLIYKLKFYVDIVLYAIPLRYTVIQILLDKFPMPSLVF